MKSAALLTFAVFLCAACSHAQPLVYESPDGVGVGKHVVLVASDHEYRSEEALPALARILAKHHGFKCTVVFGLDEQGVIEPGANNVPGIEALADADLMVLFTRFQDWPEDQMRHFLAYLDRAGPIVGLRTSTHAFKIPASSQFAKYGNFYKGDDYPGGFGLQVLGEDWSGHHGDNHKHSTRLDILSHQTNHPILRGVSDMWVQCGGYFTEPDDSNEVLVAAQPLLGMEPTSPVDAARQPAPAAWTRTYEGKDGAEGRVFTCVYGASNDFENEGFRRMMVNSCFWAMGMEDAIQADADVSFVGPFNPTWRRAKLKRTSSVKPQALSGWDSPIFPLD